MSTTNRRDFFKKTAAAAGASFFAASRASAAPSTSSGIYMGDFIAPKLKTVKVAIIGLGSRSNTHSPQLAAFEGTEIVGLCDLHQDKVEKAKKVTLEKGKGRHTNVKIYHGDKHAYKKMLAETKPDLVYVITPWEWHAPMAIDAMNAGAHVCVEVPICTSVDDAWKIIDASERTQKHCMMLENVNYGREELLYLSMCRQGVFGEILHGEAAYIHDLRFQMKHVTKGRGTGSWRTGHWASKSGNLYPTHGLGPVAQYMNLARGEDNFSRISSFSSPARNHALYAKKNFPADHKLNNIEYNGGDMSTSIIKTTLGRTIMVQWDESSPRPYSRHNLIQGTKGTAAGFPTRIALDYEKGGGLPEKVFELLAGKDKKGRLKDHTNYHNWSKDDAIEAIYEAYEHPLYKRLKVIGQKMGGHGGMDAMMNYRVIECLQQGQALDQNLYEGCFWSAVAPLSIKSVKEEGMPQQFPDFTRGRWKDTKPLAIIS